jgi:type IV pilus assembly protein PilV
MNQRGFTLIEVMITVVILAVGLLALAQMQISAVNGNYSANNMTVASTLAQDKLEELKGLAIDAPDLADDEPGNNGSIFDPRSSSFDPDHEDPNNPVGEGGATDGVRRYTRIWNIADNTPTQGVKTAVVFVFWGPENDEFDTLADGSHLPRHRVSVSTLIGEE